MLHSRTTDNKINCLHERSLRIVYSDHSSAFEELLERDFPTILRISKVYTAWKVSKYGVFFSPNAGKYWLEKTPYLDTFHAVLAIEIYKYVKGLSPEIMNSLFHWKKNTVWELYMSSTIATQDMYKLWYRNSLVFSQIYGL